MTQPAQPTQSTGNGFDPNSQDLPDLGDECFNKPEYQPAPIRDEAFIGLTGEIVRIAADNSECNRDNLLGQLLVSLGVLYGRCHYVFTQGNLFPNENLVVVGPTGSARKGSALKVLDPLLLKADPNWLHRKTSGVQSGEALVMMVRDAHQKPGKGGKTVTVPGVEDKRKLIVEPEFGRFLTVCAREKNTLSARFREIFDSPDTLRNMTIANDIIATGVHIGQIAYITREELVSSRANLVTLVDGTINRCLWINAFGTRDIPWPQLIDWEQTLIERLARVIRFANPPRDDSLSDPVKVLKRMELTQEALEFWKEIYAEYKHTESAILKRAGDHVLKVGTIYALSDLAEIISLAHLRAAKAVVDHSNQTASCIFSRITPNQIANDILVALDQHPKRGLTLTDIARYALNHHVTGARRDEALAYLTRAGYAKPVKETCGTRPSVRWFPTGI